MKRDFKKLKAGWKMTEGQWCSFWRLWGNACRAQGWDKFPAAARDGKRREALAALGFASAKDVDKTTGFDRVKQRFEELADVLPEPADGDKKRLLHRIGEVIAELEVASFPGHRLAAILKSAGVIDGVRRLEDLGNGKLLALSAALTGVLGEWNAPPDDAPCDRVAAAFNEGNPVW